MLALCASLALTARGGPADPTADSHLSHGAVIVNSALLVLREAGGVAADFDGNPIDRVDMGLATRSSVVAARNQPTLDLALELIHSESSAPGGA